ncbi:hypothetical protein BST16_11670 [Mycobacterium asiaticum DSM 44297]|uniref:Uncharacterized protein n=1 Tax=Mycobacterium asiaticum TaxID=1790 RepID=A0A1A3ICW2_MYCAS|nr:hypothetical protein A9W94_16760 [Mycobacterium asiaticum]OBJ85609.1 hypothetical protein A5640_12125 [Mycobacterium asiaticum]ORA14554.1 hypothetical protein BST16_11670 [Mycobacterium asiaticum DSM 44297]
MVNVTGTQRGDAGDRSLIEDALNHVRDAAPVGWQRVRVEFMSAAEPPFARGWAVVGSDTLPVPVLPQALELLTEYQRRAVAGDGAGFRKVIVECDYLEAVSVHTVPAHTSGGAAGSGGERGGRLRRMWSRR